MTKIEDLKKIDPIALEHLIKELLVYKGYENVKVTKRTGDKGIDLTAIAKSGLTDIPIVVQVKRYKNNISPDKIHKFKGSIEVHGMHAKGIFITTSKFTQNSINDAEITGIELINGEKLVENINEMESKIEDGELFHDTKADVLAVNKIAEIYVEIKKKNTNADLHDLNTFMARLIFCMYAEDTGIFNKHSIMNYIKEAPKIGKQNGRKFGNYINELFNILNQKKGERKLGSAIELHQMPYVNGSLFDYECPVFDIPAKARDKMIECCELNWADINPDIFGSMFQAVVSNEQRSKLGQHYTSVENIKKVIYPLFMDSLNKEFERNRHYRDKLKILLDRIGKLRIFDPACGSGNFLIIAYKLIRNLEIKILKRLMYLGDKTLSLYSRISISQFRGIELDDFAHEIATLSLWLAEHQMNLIFKDALGSSDSVLPLKKNEYIKQGNALKENYWDKVCPKDDGVEIYILGNPPYCGSNNQTPEQKKDIEFVFNKKNDNKKNYKKLDYVACWIKVASEFIKESSAKFAFISTNSICQGEQVFPLWSDILENGQSIEFAYQSFRWTNNAPGVSAGVAVVIVGVANDADIKKRFLIADNKNPQVVENISPYLLNKKTFFVKERRTPLSLAMPQTIRSIEPTDNGHLILTMEDYQDVKKNSPDALPFLKKYIGAKEFLYDKKRFCLWITDENKDDALKIPFIKNRVDACKKFRTRSPRNKTLEIAEYPWRFEAARCQKNIAFLIPSTTTKRREYIPIGLVSNDYIITKTAHTVLDGELYVFGVLSSKMHTLWTDKTSSEMDNTKFSYSTKFSYNTFPFPQISNTQKQDIESKVHEILESRENHANKTIAQLYDPCIMPEDLRDAHEKLDNEVERCFQKQPFEDDNERVNFLFKKFEEMQETKP